MKKLLFPVIAVAALAASNVALGATFLTTLNDASHSSPWTFGVGFTIPSGQDVTISDIQVFDVKAGNTLRVGLWNNNAPSGLGNDIYHTTIVSTGAGAAVGASGLVSIGSIAPIILGAGNYTLSVSGFNAANSFGDSKVGPPNTRALFQSSASFSSQYDFIAIGTDPTTENPAKTGLNVPPGGDNPRWKSVNFIYTPVPEPETYAMVAGAALVGFGLWRRRQAK